MQKNTVKLEIGGAVYYVNSDDSAEYVEALGEELDDRISKTMKSNNRVSMTQAAILCALEFADEAKKASEVADNLRNQVKDYLEDAAKAKSERDFFKRELERANKNKKA